MRKGRASYENINKGIKIKKAIIKRINESILNQNIKTIESQRNKKMHLYLNNDSNSYYNRQIKFLRLPSKNNDNSYFVCNEKLNNVFLEKNNTLLNSNKTRNKITYIYQNNENNLISRKKALFELNFKNIFLTSLNSRRSKNKLKKELIQ